MAKGNPIYVPYGYKEQPILNPKDTDSCSCDMDAQKKLDQAQSDDISTISGLTGSKLDVSAFTEYSGSVQTILDDLVGKESGLTEDLNELIEKTDFVSGVTSQNTNDITTLSGVSDTLRDAISGITQSLSGKADVDYVNQEINNIKNDIGETKGGIDKLSNLLSGFTGNIADALSGLTDIVSGKTNIEDFEKLSGDVYNLSAFTMSLSGDIPTKVSQLENDVPYLTEHQSLDNYLEKDKLQSILDNYNEGTNKIIDALSKNLSKVSGDVETIESDLVDIVQEIEDLDAEKASLSDLKSLSGQFTTYNTKLADFEGKVALMANRQTVDALTSKVNGLTSDLSQKANSIELQQVSQKLEKHLKDSEDLSKAVNETLPLAIDALKTQEEGHYKELSSKIASEAETRKLEDGKIYQKVEDTKQELIGLIQSGDTSTLNLSKDYANNVKDELDAKITGVEDSLKKELKKKVNSDDVYLKGDVDNLQLEQDRRLSGAVDTRIQEVKNIITEKEQVYDKRYGDEISANRTLINELRNEYDKTKQEVHKINEVLFGPKGDRDATKIQELLNRLDEMEDLSFDKLVTQENLSAYTYSKAETDKKIFFAREESGNSIVKNQKGETVIEVTTEGVLKLNVEGEMMSINDLLGQLAHETY